MVPVLFRVAVGELPADCVHFCAGLPERHAGAEPSDHREHVQRAQKALLRSERARYDDVRPRRPPESRRQHPHHLVRLRVEQHLRADDVGARAEGGAPEAVGENRNMAATRIFFFRTERATLGWRDTERVEEGWRRSERAQPLRLDIAREVQREIGRRRHRAEAMAHGAPVQEISGRDRSVQATFARTLLADHHDVPGVRVRQRPPQHGVHDAEDRGRRADAERQRQDGHGRESRLPCQ